MDEVSRAGRIGRSVLYWLLCAVGIFVAMRGFVAASNGAWTRAAIHLVMFLMLGAAAWVLRGFALPPRPHEPPGY